MTAARIHPEPANPVPKVLQLPNASVIGLVAGGIIGWGMGGKGWFGGLVGLLTLGTIGAIAGALVGGVNDHTVTGHRFWGKVRDAQAVVTNIVSPSGVPDTGVGAVKPLSKKETRDTFLDPQFGEQLSWKENLLPHLQAENGGETPIQMTNGALKVGNCNLTVTRAAPTDQVPAVDLAFGREGESCIITAKPNATAAGHPGPLRVKVNIHDNRAHRIYPAILEL